MNVESNNVDLLVRLMGAATERARVIASNVANESTPGYRRETLRFEDLLKDAIDSGARDLRDVHPQIEPDMITPTRPDGNNVNLELEMNASRQNRLLYDSYAMILQSHFELLKQSIESGR